MREAKNETCDLREMVCDLKAETDEKNIIELRYFQGKTQMEVASMIGISQAQVSRLEKNALRQMKSYLVS